MCNEINFTGNALGKIGCQNVGTTEKSKRYEKNKIGKAKSRKRKKKVDEREEKGKSNGPYYRPGFKIKEDENWT